MNNQSNPVEIVESPAPMKVYEAVANLQAQIDSALKLIEALGKQISDLDTVVSRLIKTPPAVRR